VLDLPKSGLTTAYWFVMTTRMDVSGLVSVEQMNEVARCAWASTKNRCAVAQCNELPTHFLYFRIGANKSRQLSCSAHAQEAASGARLSIQVPNRTAKYYSAVAG
jgi:hypothetical protein